MLSELHIENIAVIEHADISFTDGLIVLSGETGAGKSIIIDSINAVLGSRTSHELVRNGASSALVTAVFKPKNSIHWLEENDIPSSDDLILQRKLTSDGKSSCRVCGVPVTAAQLRELGSQLIDIHGQNDGLRLLDEKSHLDFLDSFGNVDQELSAYRCEYYKYGAIIKEIRALTIDANEKERLTEILSTRIDELTNAKIVSGEYDRLKAKRDLLHNSEKLKEALDGSLEMLSDNEGSALSLTQNALSILTRAVNLSPELEKIVKTLDEATFLLKDVSESVEDIRSDLNFSDDEYNKIEGRISMLDRLQRKYSCDEEGLIYLLQESKKQLDDIQYSDDRLIKLAKEKDAQKIRCIETASKLTEARKAAAFKLNEAVTSELKDLNMPSVQFMVDFSALSKFTLNGVDDIKFLMSANAGESVGRISKIASGGELSRIMLALKNVFAKNDTVETMIFDEIDSGISGISAQRVAEKLYNVSAGKQVMCITHLPQIAAMADTQYLVKKSEIGGRTFTEVDCLDFENRKKEIARLYGGDNISLTTLAAAEEQINNAEGFKRLAYE